MDFNLRKILREELLKETLSDVVYHFTTTNKTIELLKSNQFNLTPVFGTEADAKINNNKLFMFSTTSSRHTKIGYGASLAKHRLVRFTLNGQKLNQNFKSKRVDYWRSPKDPNDELYSSTHKDDLLGVVSRQNELEDRIILDNNTIKSANQYVSVIEVLNGQPQELWELQQLCNELNITFYAYDNEKSFNGSLKDTAIDIEKTDNKEETPNNNQLKSYDYALILATLLFKNEKLKNTIYPKLENLGANVEEMQSMVSEKMEDKVSRVLNYKYDDYYTLDFMNSLLADIHNTKSNSNEIVRLILKEFGLDMKRNKCTSMKEYLLHKIHIGKKTNEDYKNELYLSSVMKLKQYYSERLEELVGLSYEYNNEYYDDLSQFAPVKNLLQTNYKIIRKKLINDIQASDELSVYPLLSDFSRQNLEKFVDCDLDSPKFKELANIIGEDRTDDVFYMLRDIIGEIARFVEDKAIDLINDSKEQWMVNQ